MRSRVHGIKLVFSVVGDRNPLDFLYPSLEDDAARPHILENNLEEQQGYGSPIWMRASDTTASVAGRSRTR